MIFPLCPFFVCLPCCFLVFSSVFSAAFRIWSTPRLLGKYVWKIWMCSLKYCYSKIKWFGETKILLDSNSCKDSIFPRTSCYETWGSWERFDFWFIDVKHASNMDHRTVKLEPWQLVPRPPTPWRLAFVNMDLWCTSTSRIDVLGRPKDSGICWTSLRNLETKTLSHNAIGTSWLTFVEIIHLQLPQNTIP